MGHLGVAHMPRASIRSSGLPTAIEDAWGRPVPDQETDDDEADRLLMPINWLCALLERMRGAAAATAGPDRVAYQELMRRLQDSSRSKLVRKHLDLAASRADAGCYDDALKALRSLTT
jgi:hypothetical protein